MPDQFLAFAFFAFVASITPGPNNVLLTATGARVGFWRGMPTLLGIVTGFTMMVFLLTFGLGSALLERPAVLTSLRFVGIAMLVWLSWQIAFAPILDDSPEAARESGSSSTPVGFVGGALFQWVNPKAWLVVASAIAAYMVPGRTALTQAITFGAVFMVAGVIGCLPWLTLGAFIQRFLTTPAAARLFNWTMGLLLLSTIVLIIRP